MPRPSAFAETLHAFAERHFEIAETLYDYRVNLPRPSARSPRGTLSLEAPRRAGSHMARRMIWLIDALCPAKDLLHREAGHEANCQLYGLR